METSKGAPRTKSDKVLTIVKVILDLKMKRTVTVGQIKSYDETWFINDVSIIFNYLQNTVIRNESF